MNSQNHKEICAVFQYYDIVVSIVANSTGKWIMQFFMANQVCHMANQTSKCFGRLASCPIFLTL